MTMIVIVSYHSIIASSSICPHLIMTAIIQVKYYFDITLLQMLDKWSIRDVWPSAPYTVTMESLTDAEVKIVRGKLAMQRAWLRVG